MADLLDFLRLPITGDLMEVPGMTLDSINKLKLHDINNTHNLIGEYLSLIDFNLLDNYLESLNININRQVIVQAIREKVNTVLPGTHCH